VDPNNQPPPDEDRLAPGLVRCSALTRVGTPCKNLAIADGRCWMHGGRKNKPPAEDKYISETGPEPVEAAAVSVREDSDGKDASRMQTGGTGEPTVDGVSGVIEISETDIELISEGDDSPKDPTTATASPPTAAGGPAIVWDGELPDEEPPADGMDLGIEIDGAEPIAEEAEDQLQILTDDALTGEEIEGTIDFDADSLGLEVDGQADSGSSARFPQGEPAVEASELMTVTEPADETAPDASAGAPDIGLDIQAGSEEKGPETTSPEAGASVEAEFEDLEIELLPDDELPAEEIELEFGRAVEEIEPAGREGADAGLSGKGSSKEAAVEDEDVIIEILPGEAPAPGADAADIEIELVDDTDFGSGEAATLTGQGRASGPQDDWPGVNNSNRFGAVAEQPEFSEVPEFVAPESEPPRRQVPEASYPRQPDTDSSDAAAGYKTRTTIGKFREIPFDTPRKGELKKIKERKPPVKKAAPFWRRRVGIPAPVFWGTAWLLLILGGISGLHYGLGTHIPYVSGLLPPAARDAGNLKIAVYGTKSRFVQNSHSGTQLVITGWVRNDYAAARGLIRVTGRLFTRTNFVKSQTVYCGDLISDETLGSLSAETIQKRLSDRFDDMGPKEVIAPRQTLPFMIVFSQLPDDLASLDKYTVEVTGSSQAR